MIGLDTGFFVEFLRGSARAISVWESLVEDEDEAVVSCLTLFELERLGLKRGIEGTETLVEAIPAVCKVLWINDPNIPSRAAALSHGLGMPAVDSLILACFLAEEIRTIYTTDAHFANYRRKDVQVINLRVEN